jgi:hypothetical protein
MAIPPGLLLTWGHDAEHAAMRQPVLSEMLVDRTDKIA